MRDLFDPRRGLGLSYLRQPMGASDFVAGPHYTYDDVAAGPDRLRPASTSRSPTTAPRSCRCCARRCALNPNLKVMATPWSPPAWMKTNDSLVGGRFKDDPRVYDAYARYFVRFIQELPARRRPDRRRHAAERAPEPQSERLPGMDLRDDEEARLVVAVGRALQRAGLHTKILGYDHNWSLHPNDVGPPDDPANSEYAASLLANPAARHYLAGTAFHCYSGDPERQSVLHDAFPQKDIYFTECSGSQSGDPATTFPDTLHWHTRFLTVGAIRNWAKTVITWNLALDPAGGPHNGGCGTCFGVVTVDPATGHATPTADYYVLGHVTRFIRPGAVRVDSTVAGNAWNVAFRNPDGSIVLVVGQRRLGHDDAALQRQRGGTLVLLRAARGRGGDLRAAGRASRVTRTRHPSIGGSAALTGPALRFNSRHAPGPPGARKGQAAGQAGARRPPLLRDSCAVRRAVRLPPADDLERRDPSTPDGGERVRAATAPQLMRAPGSRRAARAGPACRPARSARPRGRPRSAGSRFPAARCRCRSPARP